MTPEQMAAEARRPVDELGGAFAECPKTLRRARQLGLTGWAFYVAGRGGALGDVRPDTVAAALGFIAADAVRDGWEAARRVAQPTDIAAEHLAECCRWGRERLDGFAGAGRLIALAETVVLAADAAGMPLFAAWRAMPVPEEGPGARVAVLARLLREHRSAAELLATRGTGLSPLEAIIARADGEAEAIAYGWQPPFPPAGPLIRRRIWADALADRIVGEAYRVLDGDERAELLSLFTAALDVAREPVAEHPALP